MGLSTVGVFEVQGYSYGEWRNELADGQQFASLGEALISVVRGHGPDLSSRIWRVRNVDTGETVAHGAIPDEADPDAETGGSE